MDEDTTDAAWAQREQEEREAIERGNQLLAELRAMNREFAEFFNLPHGRLQHKQERNNV